MSLRPIRSPFKRRPRKRVVSRSFRVPPEVDRMLDEEARKRDWSKSFLIRDILVSWASYNKAKARIE
jgi:predicted transcriptional regulator